MHVCANGSNCSGDPCGIVLFGPSEHHLSRARQYCEGRRRLLGSFQLNFNVRLGHETVKAKWCELIWTTQHTQKNDVERDWSDAALSVV